MARDWNAPKGSVVVFDKGYNNYRWYKSLTDKGITWVTRIRGNTVYRVIERRSIPVNSATTLDKIIQYTSTQRKGDALLPIRRIGYRAPSTKKHYVFITNHFDWPAQTIADIYE